MSFLLALDQGTSSSRSIVFDESGQHRGQRAARVPADLPAARLGRARPERDLGQPARHRARRHRQGRPEGRRHPRHRHHQPARDHGAVEPAHRQAGAQRHRLAGPAHRAASAPNCVQQGLEPMVQRATGLRIDPYFSATKLRWLLDHVSGAHIAAAQGELAFGTVDSWLLWKLSGGAPARHRREQRVAHDALRHPPQRLGPRAAEGAAHPRQRAAAGLPFEPCLRPYRPRRCSARPFPSPASPATSRVRCSARPASAPGWRRTPTAPAASC